MDRRGLRGVRVLHGSGRLWPVEFWPIHFWPINFLCCGWCWCGLECLCCCVLVCVLLCVCCFLWLFVVCCCGPWGVCGCGSCGVCCCLLLWLWLWFVLVVWLLVWTILRRTPLSRTPFRRTPSGGLPPPDCQKFRAFFSVSRHQFRSFSLSLCVFSLNFGGFCEDRGRQMCTFGVLVLLCEAPAALKPPGFHTTSRVPKRAHLRVPVFTKTTKIPREDTQREKKEKNVRWEREKKARNFGPSHPSGFDFFWVFAPPLGP